MRAFLQTYCAADDAQTWFGKVKAVAEQEGFASDMKEYKARPEDFKGSVSDVAEVLRIAVTGKANTPDLWTIMQILGEKETVKRISEQIS